MSITYSADELLRVAEQIERNGIAFYSAAALQATDAPLRALLQQLATWEDSHAATFSAMRAVLTPDERESDVYDPENAVALYLRAFADSVVFTNDTPSLPREAGVLDILELAMAREKDSIVFYTGMRQYLPARMGADRLEKIIQEEYSHLATLQQQRQAVVHAS